MWDPLRVQIRWCALLVVLLLVGWGTAASLTHAQIYVDAEANAGGDGSSWASAYTDLQDALSIATGNDQIWMAAGTYTPGPNRGDSFTVTGEQDGLQMYGGFAGTETALTERDLGAGHQTILSGDIDQNDYVFAPATDSDGNASTSSQTDHINGENSDHVLVFDGGEAIGIGTNITANVTPATVLDGVTVANGQARGGFPNDSGGGLYCDGRGSDNECSPTIANVIFVGNTASHGGAIYNNGGFYGTSSPQVTNVVLVGNTADKGSAIYNFGQSGISSPRITHGTFMGNAVSGSDAGGTIYNNGSAFGTSHPQITNTMLWGNASGSADAIVNNEAAPAYRHTLVQGMDVTGTGNLNGTDPANNPLFIDAADLSGADGVFGTADDGLRLSVGSPALNAGDNGAIRLANDITGAPRSQGPAVDLGAYEGGVEPPRTLYVDADATGTGDGSSWTDAFATLQDALSIAMGTDQIWMAAGTYYPDAGAGPTDNDRNASFRVTGDQDGLNIYGGFTGTETALTERDLAAGHETILSGDIDQNGAASGNSYHVLVFDGGTQGPDVAANVTPATVLDGVTVTGGQADGSYLNDGNKGGGLYCDGAGSGNECSPQIRNAVFTGNAAGGPNGGSGGAMYNMGGSGGRSSPVITNVTFIGNVSDGGGAIYNDGLSGVSSPVITNATFTGNVARDRFSGIGGAIYNRGASGVSSPQITNATFIGNVAYDAGAIYSNDFAGGTSRPQITNTMLWGNTARFGDIDEIGSTGAAPQYRHSLVQDVDLTSQGLGNLDGTTSSSDPLFADTGTLSGPDGVVGTADDGLRLSPGSPALDGGTNAPFEAGGVAESIATDRAGAARVQDGTVDLGAYEGVAGRTSATETVASNGPVDFSGTGVRVTFVDVSGTGTVTVQATAAPPPDLGGLDPGFVAGYRLAIEVTGDLTFGPATEIRVGLARFGDVPDPNEAVIYRRATIGAGTFSPLPTTYDAATNELVATTGAFSEFVVYKDPTPIPVELATFSGAITGAAGREAVTLRWETLSETNNAGFDVQRATLPNVETPHAETSQWGVSTWHTIARIEGAGTTDEPQSYQFEDAGLPYAADSLSYRLRQVDTDGTESFSKTVTIARQVTQAELLPTYPNPVRGHATVHFAVPERQAVRIVLYDLLGRRVQTVVNADAEGRTEHVLDVSGLASGTYFLRMQTEGHTETQRITVVR